MTVVLERSMMTSLRYSPYHGLTYISNQKCGCTSMQYTLWRDFHLGQGITTLNSNVHDYARSPFLSRAKDIYQYSIDNFEASSFFTVVRNPYARVLSAYLHQVMRGNLFEWLVHKMKMQFGKSGAWEIHAKMVNVSPWSRPNFHNFLVALTKAPPSEMGSHFRPQIYNVLWGTVKYDHVGYLEDLSETIDYLSSQHIDMKKRSYHGKNAVEKIKKYFGPEEVALVQQIYADDFDGFGYSKNIDDAAMAGSGAMQDGDHVIGDFIRSITGGAKKRRRAVQ